jgi:hypothetical protein
LAITCKQEKKPASGWGRHETRQSDFVLHKADQAGEEDDLLKRGQGTAETENSESDAVVQ